MDPFAGALGGEQLIAMEDNYWQQRVLIQAACMAGNTLTFTSWLRSAPLIVLLANATR